MIWERCHVQVPNYVLRKNHDVDCYTVCNCLPRLEVDHGLGACAHVGDQLGARVDQRHDIQAASALAFNTAAAIAAARAREAQQFKLLRSVGSILQMNER